MASPTPLNEAWARVALIMAANATIEYECIHWYEPDIVPSVESGQIVADALADALDVALRDPITATLTTTCSYIGVRVVLHIGENFFSASDNTGANVGDLAVDFQPPQVAVVLQKGSTLAGKPGHGRFFWPLVPESLTTGYRLNATGVTAYEALAAALLADVVAATVNFVPSHFSRFSGFLYPLTTVRPLTTLKRQGRRELVPLYQ